MQEQRNLYMVLAVAFVVFPFIGYCVNSGFVLPSAGELLCLPLNFGTYGIAGIFAIFALVLIICTLYVLVACIRNAGFSLVGILASIGIAIFFFGATVTVVFEGIGWLYSLASSWAGKFAAWPIPGVCETLGEAILGSALYDIPLVVFLIKARKYRKLCSDAEVIGAKIMQEHEEV